ncbi:hypothetical protein GGI35DRAFT_155239 [Trichoderma velutinum]
MWQREGMLIKHLLMTNTIAVHRLPPLTRDEMGIGASQFTQLAPSLHNGHPNQTKPNSSWPRPVRVSQARGEAAPPQEERERVEVCEALHTSYSCASDRESPVISPLYQHRTPTSACCTIPISTSCLTAPLCRDPGPSRWPDGMDTGRWPGPARGERLKNGNPCLGSRQLRGVMTLACYWMPRQPSGVANIVSKQQYPSCWRI